MANGRRHGGGRGGGGRGQDRRPRSDEERRQGFVKDFGDGYAHLIANPEKPDSNAFIDSVKKYVKRIQREITTSQLRNVFSRVKYTRRYQDLYLLRPKLAYVAGRADREGTKELMLLLDDVIRVVDSDDKLKEFQNFFEAIIAYHKYFGGKD